MNITVKCVRNAGLLRISERDRRPLPRERLDRQSVRSKKRQPNCRNGIQSKLDALKEAIIPLIQAKQGFNQADVPANSRSRVSRSDRYSRDGGASEADTSVRMNPPMKWEVYRAPDTGIPYIHRMKVTSERGSQADTRFQVFHSHR